MSASKFETTTFSYLFPISFILSFGETRNKMSEESGEPGKVQYKNAVLSNNTKTTKLGLFSLTGAVIVLCSVGCEIGKQVSNYSINYYNGGRYPLPQTIMVSVSQANTRQNSLAC